MTTFQDITVVVQGPVQTFQDRQQEPGITEKCLASVRKHLPGARIILSTWPGQDLTNLDYDDLVISEDPGPNVRYYKLGTGKPRRFNNNRQIVSTREGLRRVNTPYAVKLRSDNFLTDNSFVALQQSFPERCLERKYLRERVVVSNIFTRRYAKGFPVAFHLSDFFYFGRTEDLLTLWDLELCQDVSFPEPSLDNRLFPVDCTQLLCLKALERFDPAIKLDHLLDAPPDKLRASDICYANNFIIASPDELGLGLCQRFVGKVRIARLRGKCAQWQHTEWKDVYDKYCAKERPTINGTRMKGRFLLFLQRCIYVFPTRLETRLKLRKRARMASKQLAP